MNTNTANTPSSYVPDPIAQLEADWALASESRRKLESIDQEMGREMRGAPPSKPGDLPDMSPRMLQLVLTRAGVESAIRSIERKSDPTKTAAADLLGPLQSRIEALHRDNLALVRESARAQIEGFGGFPADLTDWLVGKTIAYRDELFFQQSGPNSAGVSWVIGDGGATVLDPDTSAVAVLSAYKVLSKRIEEVERHTSELSQRLVTSAR